jgi:ligand-binding sensor domain-containing protein/serine phosphatase RsbU (regulator of sigma subunit)
MMSEQIKGLFPRVVFRPVAWFLLLALGLLPASAQKVAFKNYTIQNGLPQNTVNGICQDTDGYIWFATQVGVARFDGYDFQYYTISNGLPHNYVNCLLAARNGHVWFGTEGGIADFNGTEFRIYEEGSGLISNKVDRLEEDLDGNIWVATAYGLSVITPDTILSYTKEDALTDHSIDDIFVDSRGRVHVATSPRSGLTLFQDPFTYEKIEMDEIILDILETREGDIWYATQGIGIVVRKEHGMERLGFQQGLTDEIVLSMGMDHLGRIWCGTYVDGIFLYENGRFNRVSTDEDHEPIAREIHEDAKHRIWIVDYQQGVWLKDRVGFRNLTMENTLVNDIVYDILEDKYGSIWLGTNSGASKYGRALFEVYDTDGLLPENDVTAVFMDSHDRLWFCPYGYLMYLNNNRMYMLDESRNGFDPGTVVLSFAEDLPGNVYVGTDKGLFFFNGRYLRRLDYWGKNSGYLEFHSLYQADDGILWCGTDQGLYVMDGNRTLSYHGDKILLDLKVNAIDRVGERVYCATEGGVSVFDAEGQHLINYTASDGLASNVCNDITHDGEGNIWVATDQGLSRISGFESPVISTYNAEVGLTSNSVYFLAFYENEYLWMGTEKGLFRYRISSGSSDYYGIYDGFYPLETYLGAVSPGMGKDLWMGTVSGLVHYLPEYDVKDSVPPDLILAPPLVQGQPYRPDEHAREMSPTFPYNRNTLEFNFTGIHTTVPEKNRFSYFLQGYDDEWSTPGTDRSVTYKRISNGHYVFKVRAYNLDGVETEQEASFAFIINPPVWKTFWFIILEVLAGLALVYATIKYRERQLIREKRVLETKVKERTKEIEDQKVEIEAQRDEIFEKNKEITDSIHYAKHIQQAVLPGKITLERTLPEHFILFRPRDIVSGDFYWVEQKQDRVVVCAADCTGHGVPGAFMSLLGLTFLNEIVNKDEILKASEILNRLRSYIINAMSHKDQQARDGMDVSLVVIDRQLNIMEYAGAYNPLVMIRKGEILEYKADKMPIGKHEGEEGPFTNHRIILEEGDTIYLFSDGFSDQFGGESGNKYKAKPFRRLLQRICETDMQEQEKLLEDELNQWMQHADQVDDILVMGIRYTQKS